MDWKKFVPAAAAVGLLTYGALGCNLDRRDSEPPNYQQQELPEYQEQQTWLWPKEEGYEVRVADLEGIREIRFYNEEGKEVYSARSLRDLREFSDGEDWRVSGHDEDGDLLLGQGPGDKEFKDYKATNLRGNLPPKNISRMEIEDKKGDVRVEIAD